MSHNAEKCKKGGPLGFINIYSVAKYQKTRKGDSFETLKNFRKKSHAQKAHKKCPNTQKVPFVLRKRLKSSDIAYWATWEPLFSNLSLPLSKTQFTLDITS